VSLLTTVAAATGKTRKDLSTAAAIGKHFPASEFRGQLLP
jgi:hypothetical protein